MSPAMSPEFALRVTNTQVRTGSEAKNISALVRRRKLLIKQQQDASSKRRQDPFGDKHLHKLNTAFEFLRTELQGTTDLRYLSERVIEGWCNSVTARDTLT